METTLLVGVSGAIGHIGHTFVHNVHENTKENVADLPWKKDLKSGLQKITGKIIAAENFVNNRIITPLKTRSSESLGINDWDNNFKNALFTITSRVIPITVSAALAAAGTITPIVPLAITSYYLGNFVGRPITWAWNGAKQVVGRVSNTLNKKPQPTELNPDAIKPPPLPQPIALPELPDLPDSQNRQPDNRQRGFKPRR